MPTEKPRYTIIVDHDLLKQIDDFRFENRFSSRSAATLELIRLGISYTRSRRNKSRQQDMIPDIIRINIQRHPCIAG